MMDFFDGWHVWTLLLTEQGQVSEGLEAATPAAGERRCLRLAFELL